MKRGKSNAERAEVLFVLISGGILGYVIIDAWDWLISLYR